MNETNTAFQRLVKIMDELREQCPWDKKQTIATLRSLTIEETYELADAITEGDWKGIREELGDLFLHLVFYARIGREQGQFTLDEVLNGICDKLIARHPHIYPPQNQPNADPSAPSSGTQPGADPQTPAYATGGLVEVKTEEDVKRNWEQLKLR